MFTRLGKGRGNLNWFHFGYVRFITETLQILLKISATVYCNMYDVYLFDMLFTYSFC